MNDMHKKCPGLSVFFAYLITWLWFGDLVDAYTVKRKNEEMQTITVRPNTREENSVANGENRG